MNKREFIINQLMKPGFITKDKSTIELEEMEDSGRSRLTVHFPDKECLSIPNVDKKHTDLYFFKEASQLSMYKRVDHIIFEPVAIDAWNIHLFEMKGSVSKEKWVEIKGKFRASYLLVEGLAAILNMKINDIIMYTTFEKVVCAPSPTIPSSRRVAVGQSLIKMQDEWNGSKFGLNLGDRIKFKHIPVQMNRDSDKILIGTINL